ncbi:hypothetical protein GWG65_03480 [Bradyrhizobium sp. CSA207]|uniref:hypothetical protein n=1 Tax=Bradyrhizobium sp. CSA207 TaxID=2698826 RepID=UPI0023B06C9D|nr:hypothetical protein [Bradyrhizobium sp. CSA207]MDE5440525.1 hypothetical protein [Bradyrhizobium sp. CSA207]
MKKPSKPALKIVSASTATTTQPSRNLGKHGLALWNKINSEYEIEDAGGVEVLVQICSTLDRAESLAAEVDRDGPVVMTKHGLKEHPALRAELGCRAFITRNLQRLGLNLEPLKNVGRPPGAR